MPARLFPIKKDHPGWRKTRRSGKPVVGFRLEVPDNAAAYENIVLAARAGVHIQLRHTRPEVSIFTWILVQQILNVKIKKGESPSARPSSEGLSVVR